MTEALAVTYSYDHASGVFTGQGSGSKSFSFRFALGGVATDYGTVTPNVPVALRMELEALARREIDLVLQQRCHLPPEAFDYEAIRDRYYAQGGIAQKCGVIKYPIINGVSLEDLEL